MFRLPDNFRSTLSRLFTGRRLALAAAPLLIAGAAAPMMGAGPVEWNFSWGNTDRDRNNDRDRDHGRDWDRRDRHTEIIIRPAPHLPAPRIIEAMPMSLNLTAYQNRGTIMIFATGVNRTGGFATSLSAIDTYCAEPVINLCNINSGGYCTEALTPFSINAGVRVDREVRSISVRVAGQTICVPVTCVPSI